MMKNILKYLSVVAACAVAMAACTTDKEPVGTNDKDGLYVNKVFVPKGEIASIIGEMNVSIRAAQVQTDDRTRISTLKLTLDVHSREQMDRVIATLRNKTDVLDVYRVTA
jgi:hypothetical protein